MGANETFLLQALQVINSTPNHPLASLVNPDTGKWWVTSPYNAPAEHLPSVQAGHILSKSAGGTRLALQDGHTNQLEGRFVETFRSVMDRGNAVNIGGVPVDLETARVWEHEGIIPQGTVNDAALDGGWSQGDHLIAPPHDAFPSEVTESLPGGVGTMTITAGGSTEALVGLGDLALLLAGGLSVLEFLAVFGIAPELDHQPHAAPEDSTATRDTDPATQPHQLPKKPSDDESSRPPPAAPANTDPPPGKTVPPPAPATTEPPLAPWPPSGGGDSGGGIPGTSGGGPGAATSDTGQAPESLTYAAATTTPTASSFDPLTDSARFTNDDADFELPGPHASAGHDADFELPGPHASAGHDADFELPGPHASAGHDADFYPPPAT